MKNVKIILTTIFIVIITIILSSSVYAGKVDSVNATENEGKITISGTVDSSVYAVAVVVYSGSNLEYMETANVNADGTYSKELDKKFDYGTYEVRVADYNGGDYKTVSVEVKKVSRITNNNTTENSTTDNATIDNSTTDNVTMDNTTQNSVPENVSTDNTLTENNVTEYNTADSKEKSNNPKTGDNIVIYVIIFAIAVIGLVISKKFIKSKKRISKH